MDQIAEIGVGAIVALLIIKEVLGFVIKMKAKKDDEPDSCKACSECRRLVKDLHAMHAVRDADGVPVWYVRRSMETAIEKLTESIAHQTIIMEKLITRLDASQ